MSEEDFSGRGGVRLHLWSWLPEGAPRAVVAICPGFNAYGGLYAWTAEQLVAEGFAVYAVDLRGRGKSDGERFYVDDIEDYVADVDAMIDIAHERNPGLPLILLGHSAGGVAVCCYALEHQDKIDALICESFAFQVPAPGFLISALKGLSHIAPHLGVLKLKMEDFSRDPATVAALNADPLVAGESQPAMTIAALARADERLHDSFGGITVPLLILHGTEDHATVYHGSEYFHANAGSADKTLKLYEGHYHDLLNDVGKEEVMADIKGWIDARFPASPSKV